MTAGCCQRGAAAVAGGSGPVGEEAEEGRLSAGAGAAGWEEAAG